MIEQQLAPGSLTVVYCHNYCAQRESCRFIFNDMMSCKPLHMCTFICMGEQLILLNVHIFQIHRQIQCRPCQSSSVIFRCNVNRFFLKLAAMKYENQRSALKRVKRTKDQVLKCPRRNKRKLYASGLMSKMKVDKM